jgi:hypothetical protein
MRRVAIALFLASCTPDLHATRSLLSSTNPAEREKAAGILARAYAKDPKSLGDHGEAHWAELLKKVPGSKAPEALAGARSMGGEGGGGGFTENYQLDDFWAASVWGAQKDHTYTGYEGPRRHVEHVDVMPPASFTGAWTTYFVNGARFEVVDFESGKVTKRREYHDNGRLRVERTVVDGQLEGNFTWTFADGTTELEETYSKGKKFGVERRFWPGGKLREESHWAGDKLDGKSIFFERDGKPQQCTEWRMGEMLDAGCAK